MQKIDLTFLGEEKKRLDVFIAENTEISRTRAQGLINDGMVTVNGKTADKNCKLKNKAALLLLFIVPMWVNFVLRINALKELLNWISTLETNASIPFSCILPKFSPNDSKNS